MMPPKPPRKSLIKSNINSYDVPKAACKEVDTTEPAVADEIQSEVKFKPVPRPRSKILPKTQSNSTTNAAVDPVNGNEPSKETNTVSSQHEEQPADKPCPGRPPPRPPVPKSSPYSVVTAAVDGGRQCVTLYSESNVKPSAVSSKPKTLPSPKRPPLPSIYYDRPSSLKEMRHRTYSQQSTIGSQQDKSPGGQLNYCQTFVTSDNVDRPAVPPRLSQCPIYEPSSPQPRPPPCMFSPPPPPPPSTTATLSESVYSEIEHRPYLDVLPEDEDTLTRGGSVPRSGLRFQSNCFSSRQSRGEADETIVMLRWLARISKSNVTPSLYGLSIEEEIRSFNQRAMNVSKALRLFNLLMMKRSECMRNIITEFNAISNSLDKMKKKTKTMGIAGGTTGAVGGMTAVLGIALAPVTMGASLIATAVGAGMVASAGGMGAHTAKCNKKTVNKMTVVKLVYDYKSNVVDLESCLDFILSGMNDLRRHDIPRLQRAGAETDALKVAHLSQTVFREIDNEKRTSQGLSSEKLLRDFTRELDQYFTGEDDQILKKSNKSRFSGRVHLLAKNLQDHLEHLNRMWEMFS
ncbi:uncharacterized protein LOC103393288 [Cynoglossus semilaevis]|nr:uncharacterized protein LOC103393288 [Cynoglossus semilaevis]XP_008328417.1 uncharacterized protein LOC103393288 [Cynoglossus semilaevis]XP_016895796.1 uncharacterized protein LOC103393288 [Cynoglossus semilaevis]XP_016895797.1 uncharacterized protein LOC103393288 [Cynoglossus semilaevis]XP_024920079.1 uncharacterized protein LOC103393288 [Cynoglossus semilaevis]XP_024920080.1 uncharacterized protein LOC103393288 [Cynoglossus semilaevis]XP_024920081.1 uncharacterized protein LOC103393288 [